MSDNCKDCKYNYYFAEIHPKCLDCEHLDEELLNDNFKLKVMEKK